MNPVRSEKAFDVLKAVNDLENANKAQIELQHGIPEDKAFNVLKALEEDNLVFEVENTDPQQFELNMPGFYEAWLDLWSSEIGEAVEEPENIAEFLETYVRSYLDEEENSTVFEMLVPELFLALNLLNEERLPRDYQGLLHQLSEHYEGERKSSEYARKGLGFKP